MLRANDTVINTQTSSASDLHLSTACHDYSRSLSANVSETHGLAMLTPHDVHYGLAEQRLAERAAVLAAALRRTRSASRTGCPRRTPCRRPSGSTNRSHAGARKKASS